MRIAVGGIHIECSTFNPILTDSADFRVVRGPELLADTHFRPLGQFPKVDFLPTLHARCIPGGPVSTNAYQEFKMEFLSRLRALGPVDGLYLAMHGAMFVEGMEDAEGDWISAARETVGPGAPIAVTYDLHGNLSRRVIDAIDVFSTYRTAPHIDLPETMSRAMTMLVRTLAESRRPQLLWVPIPVVLPGERTSTVDVPARSLYARLPAIEAREGIWDASLLVGYVWADEPRATAAVVMTGTDFTIMEEEARQLALAYWEAREQFDFGMFAGSVEECLDRAEKAGSGPAILADSGDNPTAGGVGDRPDILHSLLARGMRDILVAGIADRPATEAAFEAGVGSRISLTIGATLDPTSGPPVTIDAIVRFLADAGDPSDREAVVETAGITVVLGARRRPYHNACDFERLGLRPAAAKILVVKSGYLSPELAPLANPGLLALSPGVVDQQVERLARHRMSRPVFPFDRDFTWTPQIIRSIRSRDAAEK